MIRRRLPTVLVGRFSPTQAATFGRSLVRGCGYIACGPVAVVFILPRRLEKPDPVPSLVDINTVLREVEMARRAAQD